MQAELRPALVLDLDNTLRPVDTTAKPWVYGRELYTGIKDILARYKKDGYLIAVVTNQAGLAFGHKTADEFFNERVWLRQELMGILDEIIWCPFHEMATVEEYRMRSLRRKPEPGMLALLEERCYQKGIRLDWDRSIMVGDMPEDRQMAERAGLGWFCWSWDFFEGVPQPAGGRVPEPPEPPEPNLTDIAGGD